MSWFKAECRESGIYVGCAEAFQLASLRLVLTIRKKKTYAIGLDTVMGLGYELYDGRYRVVIGPLHITWDT